MKIRVYSIALAIPDSEEMPKDGEFEDRLGNALGEWFYPFSVAIMVDGDDVTVDHPDPDTGFESQVNAWTDRAEEETGKLLHDGPWACPSGCGWTGGPVVLRGSADASCPKCGEDWPSEEG